MLSDLRLGARSLLRSPGFSFVAVTTLAVTIAAACLVYSVAYAVLFRPLPYKDPDRLQHVFWGYRGAQATRNPTGPDFLDWRDRNSVFEDMATTSSGRGTLRLGDYPEPVRVTEATTNLFRLLGVQPVLGRAFSAEEGQSGQDRGVAILGYDYWQEQFRGDPKILSRILDLADRRVVVVGVLPAGFRFTYSEAVQIWLPRSEDRGASRGWAGGGLVTGRLRRGVTPAQAAAGMRAVLAGLAREYPDTNRNRLEVRVVSLLGWSTSRIRTTLLMLMGAAGLLLLIGCGNVASLFLARLIDRERETLLRAALGASRWRIVRQLLAEGLLVSLSAGALGLLVSWFGLDLLRGLLPAELPRGDEVRLDLPVAAFALALSVAATVVSGLIPALKCSRVNVIENLTGAPTSTSTGRGKRLRLALVAAETALGLVLLSGAGLMMNSIMRLLHVDLGFDPKGVLAANVQLDQRRYATRASQISAVEEMLGTVRGIAGAHQVGAVFPPPLLGGEAVTDLRREPGLPPDRIRLKIVAGDYFTAMRVPLLAGRLLTAQDGERTERVAVVNQSLARLFYSDGKPVGRHLYWLNQTVRIVGVVADGRNRLLLPPEPEMYVPAAQTEIPLTTIVARYDEYGGAGVSEGVRAALRKRDPDGMVRIDSFEEAIVAQGAQLRFLTTLIGGAGLLGLILTASGVFGVSAYAVRRRRRELGIRMALGAAPSETLRAVLREGAAMAVIGTVLGIPIVLALQSVLRSIVFEVRPSDPVTLAVVVAVLWGTSAAASWLPARDALRVDPAVTLRHE